VVITLVWIDKVDQRRAQLVLGWVTIGRRARDGLVLLRATAVPAGMAILSVCLSVRHNLVPNQAQVR